MTLEKCNKPQGSLGWVSLLGALLAVAIVWIGSSVSQAAAAPVYYYDLAPTSTTSPANVASSAAAGQSTASALSGAFLAAVPSVSATEEEAAGGVYSLRDAETGEVLRTGRSVNLAQRAVQHANDPLLGDLEFQVEYRTDDYAEQRGLEQLLYDENPSALAENGGFNKIRGISLSNPNLPLYQQAAQNYLGGG